MTSNYTDALARAKKMGVSHCDDAAFMATFCANVLQHLVGAVSPKLVWNGAQSKGLTTVALTRLAHDDIMAVADLQWL